MVNRMLGISGLLLCTILDFSIGYYHEKLLMENLLTNYSSYVRPSDPKNITNPIDVQISLRLLQVFELEEKSQILTSSVFVLQRWTDKRLIWNHSDHGNVSTLLFSPSVLWTPDVVVMNNAVNEYSGKAVGMSAPVHVNSNGETFWYSDVIIKSYCKMKVLYFPFDEQFCHINFSSWSYNETDLKLVSLEGTIKAVLNYTENSAWELDDVHRDIDSTTLSFISPRTPKTMVVYTLHLKRKAFYYFVYLFAPCLLTSLLMIMVFILPPECGERMVVGITSMLALTVFFLLAAKNIPETSEDVPLMGRYYSATLIQMAIGLLCTAIVLKFHYSSSKMPNWVRVYILKHLARIVRIETPQNRKKKSTESDSVQKKTAKIHYKSPESETSGLVLLAEQLIDNAVEDAKQNEWKLAAKVVNRFFLIIYVVVCLLTVLGIFAQTPGLLSSRPKFHEH